MYFQARRFYLPRDVANRVDELLQEMKSAHVGMAMWAERQASGRDFETDHGARVYDAIGMKGRETVRKKIPPLIEKLEDEFRRIVEGID